MSFQKFGLSKGLGLLQWSDEHTIYAVLPHRPLVGQPLSDTVYFSTSMHLHVLKSACLPITMALYY